MRSGQVVVLGIVAIALTATGYAWLHHRGQGENSLEFWGSENALLVRRAKNVTLFRIGQIDQAAESTGDTLDINGNTHPVLAKRDISQAKGLVHFRQALIFDPTYDWEQSPQAPDEWRYAVRFDNNGDELIVLFDPVSKLIGHDQPAKLAMVNMPGRGDRNPYPFESFFEEILALPEKPPGE